MSTVPAFRFAVFTDLHVGATTANRWHNQFLSDDPAGTAAETVAAVNRRRPEFVAILGDLSDTATDEQLTTARAVLDRLEAPWFVCQGNHDVTDAGERAAFDRAFSDRAPVGVLPEGLLPLPPGIAAVAFEGRFARQDGRWRVELAEDQLRAALERLRAERPEMLLVFCHFPLVRQSEHVATFGGKNAGTIWDGERYLSELVATAGVTLCFAGHQHFHHIAKSNEGPCWLHCTTASLAEYPAEFRVIEVMNGEASIATHPGAPHAAAAAPPPEVTWPSGRPEDRRTRWRW